MGADATTDCYRRLRRGRGFSYVDGQGQTVKDAALRKWFASLAIPPAWNEVEISASRRAKLLVTGRDQAGRKQYIYHPSYRRRREAAKFDRLIAFAQQLETMRRVTGQHLRRRKLNREKVLACMVRLLDLAYFRPGSPRYVRENDSYGLTTMRSRHLTIEGDELIFRYRGKAGKEQVRQVEDRRLARVVAELDDLPGYHIFKYLDQDGKRVAVSSDDLNAYIREIMGEDFSAKDFRTWAGTLIAAVALDELGLAGDPQTADRNVRRAVERVAGKLGNTPTIARASYIDPRVIEQYLDGRTTSYFRKQVEQELKKTGDLSLEEIGLLYLLKERLE
jgi:DNA topoisomerase-1